MAMTAAQQAEFDELMAAQNEGIVATAQMTPEQQAEFDKKKGEQGGPSLGEQAMDVARVIGGANRGAAELTADVSRLPLTYMQRVRNARKGFTEGEGALSSMGGYLGGLFGETDYDREMNEALFASQSQPDLYKEEVGKGEGDWWLDPLKTGAEITTGLAGTAWMGGGGATIPKAVGKNFPKALDELTALATPKPFLQSSGKTTEQIVKTIPVSTTLGVVGEEVGGEIGEAAGVITGALTGGPVQAAKLVARLFNPAAYKRGGTAVVKKLLGGDVTLETATPSQINKALNAYVRQAYPGLPENELASYIKQLTPKVEEAIKQNKKGTVGQLTEDPGLLSFEKEMTDVGSKLTRREDVSALNRVNAGIAEEATTPMGAIEGVTEQAADVPARLVQTMKQKDVNRGAAEVRASQPFRGEGVESTTEASTALRQTMKGKADESYAGVKEAWAGIPDGATTGAVVKGKLEGFYKGLKGQGKESFKSSFKEIDAFINRLEGAVTVDDISDILSMFSSKINQIKTGAATGVALKPERIDQFKEAIYSAMDVGGAGASAARTRASNLSRDHFQMYGRDTQLGKALADKDPKEFASSYLASGDAGAARADELIAAGGDEAGAGIDRFVRSEIGTSRLAGDTSFKPSDVKAIDKKYREQLSPEMQSQVDALRKTSKAKETSAQQVKDIEKSPVGKFSQAVGDEEAIVGAAHKIMGASGKNRTADLKALVDSIGDNPEAKANLRRAFMDDFVNSVSKDGKLTQKSYDTFKRRRKVYEDAGLYSKQELDDIESGLQEGQKLFLHGDNAALANLPPERRRVLEVVSAIAGAKAGASLFGSPLIGAAIGKKATKEAVEQMTNTQARQLAFELSTNPEKFVEQIRILKKGDLSNNEASEVLKEMLKNITTATGDVVEGTLRGSAPLIPAVAVETGGI